MAAIREKYKIVMLGRGGVGKSSLTLQFTDGAFSEEYDPTIDDSYTKQASIDGQLVQMDIIDTAGQEAFVSITESCISGGDGFIVVYDITSPATFAGVAEFLQLIKTLKGDDNPVVVMCGNKCDLEESRAVTAKTGADFALKHNLKFFETSAKRNQKVVESYHECIRSLRLRNVGSDQGCCQLV